MAAGTPSPQVDGYAPGLIVGAVRLIEKRRRAAEVERYMPRRHAVAARLEHDYLTLAAFRAFILVYMGLDGA